MGIVNPNIIISTPADRGRSWGGRFVGHTDATDSLAPRQHLEAIGLAPEAQQTYKSADGSEIRTDVAVARIELLGELVGGTILFRHADAEPLFGVAALKSLGIDVDPTRHRLKKLPAVRLEGRRTRIDTRNVASHPRTR